MNLESVAARRAVTPRVAERPAWGWPPEGVEREGKPAATPMKMWPVRPCDPQTPPSPTPLLEHLLILEYRDVLFRVSAILYF